MDQGRGLERPNHREASSWGVSVSVYFHAFTYTNAHIALIVRDGGKGTALPGWGLAQWRGVSPIRDTWSLDGWRSWRPHQAASPNWVSAESHHLKAEASERASVGWGWGDASIQKGVDMLGYLPQLHKPRGPQLPEES